MLFHATGAKDAEVGSKRSVPLNGGATVFFCKFF